LFLIITSASHFTVRGPLEIFIRTEPIQVTGTHLNMGKFVLEF